jgi:sulfatase maturation enzyme AslB (radical SAM superfamily)
VNTPKTICMLPWISMEVTPTGTYRPCCLYSESIPNINVHTGHSIQDAQYSDYMKSLRQQFLTGEKPTGCQMCWNEEAVVGRMSKRKATYIKLKNVKQDYTENAVAPIFLDLKLGNICNLKCRICGSWSSSKWAQEEIDIAGGENELARQQLLNGQWPRKVPSWWEALEDALPFVEYLEFTGGEPFLINEHFDLLEKLVEKGDASKIDIHYNTNGTSWPVRSELWKHFKRVEIAFSIDDVGKRFEYQRYGTRWEETQEVIRKAVNSPYQLQVCTTFNIQNAYYWPETEAWILDQGIKDIHYNILHEPPMFNLRNMPDDIKHTYRQKMKQCRNPDKIEQVIKFMELPGENMLHELKDRLQKSDEYRKQSFVETHLDVWNLISVR